MVFSCLIVEDELPASRILEKFISEVPMLKLIATAENALEALEVINSEKVDIMFLDINLPKVKGIDMLKSIKNPPKVIFTTAYAEYALEGYELDVVDYLLKPFSFERFLKAINKAADLIRSLDRTSMPQSDGTTIDHNLLFFKADKRIIRIDLDDLLYIEGVKDYVKIVSSHETHLVLQTMKHWADVLPQNKFIRIHKSYIVNLLKVKSINGNMVKIGDREFPIGRNFKATFIKEIENKYLI